ncbi:Tat-binding like [Actinidia chinensis var. chinensis]|uniref:Tat-binding like n=1 Tax=Actinidia chinensis var. chinensis TaxID=1590841 RepID=A0A2R6RMW7_ACTCC|nr:Tat-binding like [Actinidia chinensis var. chinensis]
MGSLMAGWGSTVHDSTTLKLQRNKSLTKEEIEAYWRSKKKAEEEHLRAISDILITKSSQESMVKEPETKIQRSNSMPLSKTKELEMETETSLEKLILKNGWWTRSNSAFLNEPPVIGSEGGPAYKYASQFHVAGIATPDSNPNVIST